MPQNFFGNGAFESAHNQANSWSAAIINKLTHFLRETVNLHENIPNYDAEEKKLFKSFFKTFYQG